MVHINYRTNGDPEHDLSRHAATRMAEAMTGPALPAPTAPPTTLMLILMSLPQPFAVNAILPAIPFIMADLGLGYGAAQLSISAFVYGMATGQIVLGAISDTTGRRPVLLGGLLLFAVTTLICATTKSPPLFLTARFFEGFGAVAGVAMARSIIRDTRNTSDSVQILSYLLVGMSMGPLLGPVLGGMLTAGPGWRWIFWGLGLLNGLVILVVWFHCGETNRSLDGGKEHWRKVVENWRQLASIPAFRRAALAQGCAGAMYYTVLFGVGEFGHSLFGLTSAEMGFYYLLAACGTLVGALVNSGMVRRFGVRAMVQIGLGIVVAAAFGLLWLGQNFRGWPTAMFLPLFVAQLGTSIYLPNAVAISQNVPASIVGAASGIAAAVQLATSATVIFAFGLMFDQGLFADPVSPVVAALTIFAVLGAILQRRARL